MSSWWETTLEFTGKPIRGWPKFGKPRYGVPGGVVFSTPPDGDVTFRKQYPMPDEFQELERQLQWLEREDDELMILLSALIEGKVIT